MQESMLSGWLIDKPIIKTNEVLAVTHEAHLRDRCSFSALSVRNDNATCLERQQCQMPTTICFQFGMLPFWEPVLVEPTIRNLSRRESEIDSSISA